ncbi:hypothetical protein FALBO_9261 [Fusarium albosuccineum]|uniref:Uncharacterized protein n=1 Tax=Fusarium albosuccineum TaxID=1237068 RepID=A0A8H4L9B0_9HYPO|nr:hypothetical protein FALBO_9261 [Fusarium albosuccineum]
MVQRTFSVIPQFPGRAQSPDKPPLRPMTSKQVQKAYKAANKGPKLTRAEAWKQERAEQERIRKEFEKEKAAAKAKVAREKKKEKELAEKQEKRKKGLPLVTVRPSQDTIARFVRGFGTAKKRDATGQEVKRADTIEEVDENTTETTSDDTTKAATIEDELEQPVKKAPRLEGIEEEQEDTSDDGNEVMIDDEPERHAPKPQTLENIQEGEEDREETAGETMAADLPRNPSPKAQSCEGILGMEDDELDASFEEDLALEMLEDLEAAADKTSDQNQNPQHGVEPAHKPVPTPRPAMQNQPKGTGPHLANRYEEDLGLQRPTPPSVHFAQPSLPRQPQQTPASPSPSPPRQAPPMSTQAILCNFDDFFPSSSQQARELEEELDDDFTPSAPAPLAPIAEAEEEASEEETEKPTDPVPLPSLEPAPDSPSPPPRRFFTSSGSHELMSLALNRSRRTAALEKIQQRERSRVQAGMVARAEAESCKAVRPRQPPKAQPTPRNPSRPVDNCRPQQVQQRSEQPQPKTLREKPNAPIGAKPVNQYMTPQQPHRAEPIKPGAPESNKENLQPPAPSYGPSASQESYGGEWVDDLALELMI